MVATAVAQPPLGIYPFVTGNNPYFNQPAKVDPTVYLNGGVNFGTVGTPTGPNGYAGPFIITRNLTPDKNGRPEGGHTPAEFKQIFRHGTDFDHIHPTCTADQLDSNSKWRHARLHSHWTHSLRSGGRYLQQYPGR